MKKVASYFFVFLAGIALSLAQSDSKVATKLSYQDSLRVVLENTKNVDAMAVGAAVGSLWNGLGLEKQSVLKAQLKLMKEKGYKLRPHFVNYLGAIVNSINRENIDPIELSNYIKVAGQVIENDDIAKASAFFKSSRDFFEHHALHYEKSFRLYSLDDKYHFDYIKTEVISDIPEPDTATQDNQFDQWDNQNNVEPTTWEEPPVDTIAQSTEVSLLLPPEPQPELSGPVITFEKTTLNFSTPYDSAFLRNTKGSVSLYDNTFVGEGGTFDWSAAGLGSDSVYFEFDAYNFKVTKPELKADHGNIIYMGKVKGKVDGIFEFKSVKHKNKTPSNYPRFMSMRSNILILGLTGENMKYTGGFALNGKRIYSSSVDADFAYLEVENDSEKKFEARSRLFEFQDSTIMSKHAQVKIFQDYDSIFHPAVELRYDYGKKRLVIQKERGQMKDAPFTSSFFNVDFAVDHLRWDLTSDSMNLFAAGGRSQAAMIIESIDFYDPEDYRLLGGLGFSYHPLGLVANYSIKNGVREFYADDLVRPDLKVEEIRPGMSFLAQKGMIGYNSTTSLIQVKDKTLHFFESHKNTTDYDNLKIHSVMDGPANATINFKERRMTVRGVEEFKVSDSLNVVIKPDSSTITILKDRDIKFDGKITAGNFEINGKEFMLKYDSFFINLNHIDSIRFYLTETNAKGQTTRRRVNNAMVGADSIASIVGGLPHNSSQSSGTLFISKPNNKSGRTKLSNYPRLDATAGGVIYFDRREILNGVYDRSVFFVVPPFKLDSLNDADPGSINFEGTFSSSGMFPNFKEKLHTMPDKSLGFNHSAPATGYQLFHGDGKFFGGMSLDNSGIRSTGKIEYMAASVESKDFIFYPDSVLAKGTIGEIKEQQFGSVWFPQITLTEFQLKWLPKQDRFKLKNLRDPFNLYNATAQLNGYLVVSKKGLEGEGKLITRGSELTSSELKFSAKDFLARHASFEVKTTNPDKPALAGDDISVRFNLEKNYADISPEVEGTAAIEFPYAQFKTSITDARWDLSTQKISMTKDKDVPIENSYFYTTRKELDSLVFNAEKAEYDIQMQQLKVSGIPYIVVADAKITPENNEVLILENAKIGQLKNTTIVLDTLHGYHQLKDGVVDILSRKEFSGYATYQYINSIKDTFSIKMTNFHLEPIVEQSKKSSSDIVATQQTVGSGNVIEAEKIILAPRIFYKGDMVMYATKPALQLRGYTKLDLKKIKDYNTWLRYEQSGDEQEILIDFDNAITEDGSKAEAGLHFASDNSLYITFVFDKKAEEDEDFFLPSGSLFFDKETGEFKIEDPKKASGEKLSGKVFAYNEEKQEVRFEGPVKFFRDNNDFKITASALGSGNLETNEIKMNSLVMANVNIPPMAFQLMALDLIDIIKAEGGTDGLGDQTELLYKIADIVGEKAAKDYEQRSLQNYVSLSTIPALVQPLVFSNVNLKWSQKFKAFYSEGNLGLSNMGRYDINGAFEGFMEIRKNEDGSPVFHLFVKGSPDSWYYFGFEDNRMMLQSSNAALNELIAKKTNAAKAKVGELIYIPGSDEEALAFINRFRQNYYGIEAPYELNTAISEVKKTDKKKDAKEEDDGFK